MVRISKQKRALVIVFVATFLWLFGLRFILADLDATHYHANFVMYVDGEQDKLESFTFYEEVAACSATGASDPKSRVHLHDLNPYTVHVHDQAATWAHFAANLNYGLTDKILQTDTDLFVSGTDGKELRFVLNGKIVRNIANQTINSEDALLIDYSDSSDSTLLMRYESIPRNAGEFNKHPDPAACSGGDSVDGFGARLKRTIGI